MKSLTHSVINIGTVERATELVFMADREDHRYIVQSKVEGGPHYGYAEDYGTFIGRFPSFNVKRTTEIFVDDPDGDWFACFNVDCFDPPFAVVRARSFEMAYEVFCDEWARWLAVDEQDAKDYPEDERFYNNSGVHIDTDNVQIVPLSLVTVTCAPRVTP